MTVRLVLLAAAIVAAPAVAAERNFTVGNFTELGVVGPYDVTVVSGGAPSVHAVGDQSVLDELKVEVKSGRLEIGPRDRHQWRMFSGPRPAKIRVTVPSLSEVGLAGSGDVTVDRLKGGKVEASIAGSGNLSVAMIDSRAAKFSIAGSGDLTVAGRCATADASIAGSGDIRAKGLSCQDATASIAGSGDIALAASRTAKVSIMGSGDVTVTGGARCSVSKMGSGEARCS